MPLQEGIKSLFFPSFSCSYPAHVLAMFSNHSHSCENALSQLVTGNSPLQLPWKRCFALYLVDNSYISRALQQEGMQRELWKVGKVCFLIWLVLIRLFPLFEKLIELLFMIYVFAMCPYIKITTTKTPYLERKTKQNKAKLAM